MAIFATKAGGTPFSSSVLSVRLSDNVRDGSLLAYDATIGAFVDVCTTGLPLTTAISLGGANSHGVLAGHAGGTLTFKEIVAGSGISIVSTESSLIISADSSGGAVSVPNSYRVTIDNSNLNDDARFEVYTVRATTDNPLQVVSSQVNALTADIYTANMNGKGRFQTVNGASFFLQGFRPGMTIRVTNAGDQSGIYRVVEVLRQNQSGNDINALVLNQPFSAAAAYNLGGPKPNVLFEHLPVSIEHGTGLDGSYDGLLHYQISAYGVDFGPTGSDFKPGMVVHLSGTPDNDGNYVIARVEPKDELGNSSIVVASTTPFVGTPGPQLSASVRFEVRHAETPTGFSVDKHGHMRATSSHLGDRATVGDPRQGRYVLRESSDVVRKDNLDVIVRSVSKPLRYYMANL